MQIICTKSGNRGSGNIQVKTVVENQISNTPRESSALFIKPTSGAIAKTISISNILDQPPNKENILVSNQQSENKTNIKKPNINEDLNNNFTINEINSEKIDLIDSENKESIKEKFDNTKSKKETLSFGDIWQIIVNEYLKDSPFVYLLLKETVPTLENNIVKIFVNNEFQKEPIDFKKREILSYLRNNYDSSIEDIKIIINESIEIKKKMLSQEEEINMLKNENSEFELFIKTLDLAIIKTEKISKTEKQYENESNNDEI